MPNANKKSASFHNEEPSSNAFQSVPQNQNQGRQSSQHLQSWGLNALQPLNSFGEESKHSHNLSSVGKMSDQSLPQVVIADPELPLWRLQD